MVKLGTDIVPSIRTGHRVTGQITIPSAFNTIFSWIVMGPADQIPAPTVTTFTVYSNTKLRSVLTCFWKLEEPSLPLSKNNDIDPAE